MAKRSTSGSAILVKRVYDSPGKEDGVRILVDRLWPRGLSKQKAHIDHWLKDLAPSAELRKWFNHDPDRWIEFQKRYRAELKQATSSVDELKSFAKRGRVTLLYGAKDEAHNNALVLRDYLSR